MRPRKCLSLTGMAIEIRRGVRLEPFRLQVDNLVIRGGELVYLVGPNGSGKSSLLNAIAGLMEVSGDVQLGRCEAQAAEMLVKPKGVDSSLISLVPQDADDAIVPEMTVGEHLVVALAGQGEVPFWFPVNRLEEKLASHLRWIQLDLERRLHEFAGNLSGGERQALIFSMAMVRRPTVLLLDEFTAALDHSTSQRLLSRLKNLVKEQRLVCLAVTHRLTEASRFADRVIIVRAGRAVELDRGDGFREMTLVKRLAFDA